MKRYKIISYVVLLCITSLYSCDDYLDVQPVGEFVPTTLNDYQLLLNGANDTGNAQSITNTGGTDPLILSSDNFEPINTTLGLVEDLSSPPQQLYSWDENLFNSQEIQVPLWNNSYQSIYIHNLIINGVDDVELKDDETEQDKAQLKAEAKVSRALTYFLLVNSFGKQYNEQTAATDLAVPIITEANTAQSYGQRNTVQEVYDLILDDILTSIDHLPERASIIERGHKGAAYALLARVYLQMENYNKAEEYATQAMAYQSLQTYEYGISGQALVNNYDRYLDEQFIFRILVPGPVLQRVDFINQQVGMEISDDMRQHIEDTDTRFITFYRNCAFRFTPVGPQIICDETIPYLTTGRQKLFFPDIGEMFIVRAESRIRLGNTEGGLADLNELRSHRLVNYTPLTFDDFNDSDDLLEFTLLERRKELFATGLRLFDLKRLNKDPRFAKTITHQMYGKTYTLPPNSPNYVLQIPASITQFNTSLQLNPRE